MSTITTANGGWSDARARRARMFGGLLLACAGVALWAVFQPWFAWATPGLTPSCEPAPAGAPSISVQMANRSTIDGVAARGCVTGVQTVAQYDSPVGAAAGVSAAQATLPASSVQNTPAQMLGLPRAATVLLGCLALAWYAVTTRRGWLAVVALVFMQMPHKDLTALRQLFLGGSSQSPTVALQGLQIFTWALLAASAFMFAAAIFVLKVNFEHRSELRRQARAAGVEDPAEPLDPLTNYLGRKISKVKNAASDAARREVMAGGAHAEHQA